jgi:hypothetical protein
VDVVVAQDHQVEAPVEGGLLDLQLVDVPVLAGVPRERVRDTGRRFLEEAQAEA